MDKSTPTNWKPTRKWWSLFATTVATILANLIESGQFDEVERGMIATALVGLTAAYWTPNQDTTSPGMVKQ